MTRILVIRFSSIGDIIQCMGTLDGLKRRFPDGQIEWVTRSDVSPLIELDPRINRVWRLNREGGFAELVRLGWALRGERFDYVYDAHNNLRSSILKTIIGTFNIFAPKIATRTKSRIKRWLLFKHRINKFEWPFIGVESFRKPLLKWGVEDFTPTATKWNFSDELQSKFKGLIEPNTITIVPSANWEMKRWPVAHWQQLIKLLPEYKFVILAGPTDSFCSSIEAAAPERVTNLAGANSLIESCYITSASNLTISVDTGFLHAADLFSVKSIAILGPTAFGYPMKNHTSTVLELDMKCRPCTKDGRKGCTQSTYQQCLVDITPEKVAAKVREIIPTASLQI